MASIEQQKLPPASADGDVPVSLPTSASGRHGIRPWRRLSFRIQIDFRLPENGIRPTKVLIHAAWITAVGVFLIRLATTVRTATEAKVFAIAGTAVVSGPWVLLFIMTAAISGLLEAGVCDLTGIFAGPPRKTKPPCIALDEEQGGKDDNHEDDDSNGKGPCSEASTSSSTPQPPEETTPPLSEETTPPLSEETTPPLSEEAPPLSEEAPPLSEEAPPLRSENEGNDVGGAGDVSDSSATTPEASTSSTTPSLAEEEPPPAPSEISTC